MGENSIAAGFYAAAVGKWVAEALVKDSKPPLKPPAEDQEIDYLICQQCNTPCYIFEMDGSTIAEAQCLVCGNDAVTLFTIGEEAGSDDNA